MFDSGADKVITLTSAEMAALAGLPYLQVVLYVVGLRWWMDVTTGRVGDSRGISLASLAESLYVEPARGRSESGAPTKKAIRHALDQLEKHGLIRPCGNGEVLVFSLPKAGGVSVRPKTKGHKRGTVSGHAMGHAESGVDTGLGDVNGARNGAVGKCLKGAHLRSKSKPISVEAIAAAQPPAVERKLSTPPVLLMPLDDAQVAEWIRLHEQQRGRIAKVTTRDVGKTDWSAKGVRPEDLAEAYSLAVIDREVTKNPAPINLGFLDIFVNRVLEGRKLSRGGGAPRAEGAPVGAVGFARAAAEKMGALGQLDGESDSQFILRVADEDRARKIGMAGMQVGETPMAFRDRVDAEVNARRVSRGAAHA